MASTLSELVEDVTAQVRGVDDKCDVCGDRQHAQNPPNNRPNLLRCGRGFIAKEEQEQRHPYDSKNASYGAVLAVGVNRNGTNVNGKVTLGPIQVPCQGGTSPSTMMMPLQATLVARSATSALAEL